MSETERENRRGNRERQQGEKKRQKERVAERKEKPQKWAENYLSAWVKGLCCAHTKYK